MKKRLAVLLIMCLVVRVLHGQSMNEVVGRNPGQVSYGLDVVKSVISIINLHEYPLKSQRFLAIEPVVRIERARPDRFWLAQCGLSHITGMPLNATRLNMTGGFLKFGPEWWFDHRIRFAVLATSSVWQTGGVVQTATTAFMPYAGSIPTVNGKAFGTEFQCNIDAHLGPKWMARLNLRTNLFWKSDAGEAVETPYIPGTGLFIDSVNLSLLGPPPPTYHPVGFTVGATVQVFYVPNHHP